MKALKSKIKKIIFNQLVPTGFYFKHSGFCPCCDQKVHFTARNNWLRDYFICSSCKSIPRERALMLTIEEYKTNWRDLKIFEISPCERGASLKLKNECKNYLASQFYPDKKLGCFYNGFRNENIENLTFENEEFDLIISQDVFEHLFNPEKAFKEIARILKKGGMHIFTVPLINKHNKTELWAIENRIGEPIFLFEPEWHGNPISSNGSPVTMHWGFDIVNIIRECSGLETYIKYINNLDFGIRAEYIEVLVTIKK